MPRNRQLPLVAVFASVAVAFTIAANACPYCPRTDAPLSEKLAESDVACVVKFLESKQGVRLSMETTLFEVKDMMRAGEGLKAGSQIKMSIGVTAKKGDLFILMGQKKEDSMEWNIPIPMDDLGSEYFYLMKAPSPERPAIERLPYFLKFLDNKTPIISNDAFVEFARARFEDVEQLAPSISRVTVRQWLEDPNPQLDVRRAFYGMLLGLCGNDDDAVYLERKILAPVDPTKNRLGIEGAMGGYLLLKGRFGLQKLIKAKLDTLPAELSNDDVRLTDLNALQMTVVFLWDYRRSQFTKDDLCAAMRRFLQWPQFADMAVVDLARWKDWAPLDRLIKAYGHEPWDSRSAKEKIVGYALSCRKDVPKTAGSELPEHAMKAQKFLDSLDPEFVQSVRQQIGGPTAVQNTSATSNARGNDE